MADITGYLNTIKTGIYGEDIRDSIHDALDAVNASLNISDERNKQNQIRTDTAISTLNREIIAVTTGQPISVSTATEMTDETAVYLYTGDESGYSKNYCYVYKNGVWEPVGKYGADVSVRVTGDSIVFEGASASSEESEIRRAIVNETEYVFSSANDRNTEYGFSEGEANHGIFECASTWLKHNNELYYGNSGNPNSFDRVNGVNSMVTDYDPTTLSDGKYPLDCMSFVMMCLMGIGFEQSVFGDKSNTPYYPRSTINFLDDNVCKFIKYTANGGEREYEDNMSFERLLTWQFAMYLNSVGLYHRIEKTANKADMFKGLKTGDILFEGDPENPSYNKRFDSIFHCLIYVGNTRFGQPLIIECASDTAYTVMARWRTLEAFKLVGYARIPVGNPTAENLVDVATWSKKPGSCSQKAFLNAPIHDWDIYEVTATFTYKTESAVGTIFPAINIGNFVYSRFDSRNMPPVIVGVPITLRMLVSVSPLQRAVADDVSTILVGFYGPRMIEDDSLGAVEIVSIKSILRQEKTGSSNIYVPDLYAPNIGAKARTIAMHLAGQSDNGFQCNFEIEYSGTPYRGYFSIANSSNYMLILCNTGRHGVVYDVTGGAESTTLYTGTNTIDWNYVNLAMR